MSEHAEHWDLQPGLAFLNHGSFGACPREVLAAQQALRQRLERQPVQFFVRDLQQLLDDSREALARFVGVANPAELAWVPNATAGVNAVLRSLRFERGDELLTTDQSYGACRNTLEYVARKSGLRVIEVQLPFPVSGPEEVLDKILSAATDRTRLALIDHITSPTGLVWPIEQIVERLADRGVDVLVDGAHAPGMLPLSVDDIGAAYYTGNCHKWICAPKGAAFLHVPLRRQEGIHPPVISHGASWPATRRSRFLLEFDWLGTMDPSPYLCVPEAIRVIGAMLDGGWPAVMERNRRLALEAREILCDVLNQPAPCPEEMIGTLGAVPLPDGSPEPLASFLYVDPLQDALLEQYQVEVPLIPWPAPPKRLVRISAQLYNRRAEYERLAMGLHELLQRDAD